MFFKKVKAVEREKLYCKINYNYAQNFVAIPLMSIKNKFAIVKFHEIKRK